jgi:fatty acid-binding protein DegV
LSRVAIFTDSASDLDPAQAAAEGIEIVPLLVSFGSETYKTGVEMSTEEFWKRMVAPDAPFPKTAAASPGDFKEAFEGAVRRRGRGDRLGQRGEHPVRNDQERPDRSRHAARSRDPRRRFERGVDGQGILARMGVELADEGRPAAEIAERLEARTNDILIYVALDTLEYLKKGGRISGTSAAIGTLLSVKPIIKVKDGAVETVDKVRTRKQGARDG